MSRRRTKSTLQIKSHRKLSEKSNRTVKRKNYFQDKEQPDTEDKDLNSVPFDAVLAIDDTEAEALADQPGADGFKMNSTPLFQVRFLFMK